MAQTIVQGYSDDLVSIEGAIVEEFDALNDGFTAGTIGGILGFSNGLVVRIEFNDAGVWRITPVYVPTDPAEQVEFKINQAPENDEDNYSDVLIISSINPVRWVVFGSRCEVAK
jgi:hypothetical protein